MFPSKKLTPTLKTLAKKHRLLDKIREKYFLLFQQFQLVCILKPSYNVENSARGKCRRVSARVAEALFLPVLLRGLEWFDLKKNIAKNLATFHFNNYTFAIIIVLQL